MRKTRRRGKGRKRRTRKRCLRGSIVLRKNRNNKIYGGMMTPLGGEPMNNEPHNEDPPELHQLVEANNLEGVDDYLQASAAPVEELNEAENIEHMSPLMRAASNGNLEMVHLLLSYGADPNFIVGAGGNETALMYALVSPNGVTPDIGAIVDALLTNSQRLDINGQFVPEDADPNIPNIANHTPLDVVDRMIAEGVTETLLHIRANLIVHGAVNFNEL